MNAQTDTTTNPALSFITPDEIRVSYPHVWAPQQMNAQSKPKYGIVLLIPKTAVQTINKVRAGIEASKVQGLLDGTFKKGVFLKQPLRDGDTDPTKIMNPEFKGMWFLSANSDTKPPVFDATGAVMFTQAEFYPGCWAKVAINFFNYTTGSPGVGCGLNGIKKTRDDEAFSGKPSTEEVQSMFENDANDLV